MLHPALHTSLELAEKSAGVLTHALLVGDPAQVEAATRELNQAALDLSERLRGLQQGMAPSAAGRVLQQRLAALAQHMAMQREACARRTAAVESALHAIVPAARPATYAVASGPYGRGMKQSGAFKLLSA